MCGGVCARVYKRNRIFNIFLSRNCVYAHTHTHRCMHKKWVISRVKQFSVSSAGNSPIKCYRSLKARDDVKIDVFARRCMVNVFLRLYLYKFAASLTPLRLCTRKQLLLVTKGLKPSHEKYWGLRDSERPDVYIIIYLDHLPIALWESSLSRER